MPDPIESFDFLKDSDSGFPSDYLPLHQYFVEIVQKFYGLPLAEAEDVVDECLLDVVVRANRNRENASQIWTKAYLGAVIRHRAVEHIKKRAPSTDSLLEFLTTQEDITLRMTVENLRQRVEDSWSEEDVKFFRTVVVGILDQVDDVKMARKLDMPESTFRFKKLRMLERLQGLLGQMEP